MTESLLSPHLLPARTKTGRRQGAAGFTLLEVLVALAILAIAFGFAFAAIGGGVGWLDSAHGEQDAIRLAETMLSRLGHDIPVRTGHSTGREGRFDWALDIDAAMADPPAAGNLAAYPVAVVIRWHDGTQQLRLRSVRLGGRP